MTVEAVQAGYVGTLPRNASTDSDLRMLQQEFDELDDTGQSKHIYACYGLAAYWAQCVKVGVVNLIVLHGRASGQVTTQEMLFELEGRHARTTLGGLFKKLRRLVELEENAEVQLKDVLEKRNFLIHDFFEVHAPDWFSERGRRRMMNELLLYVGVFRRADVLIECIVRALAECCGITEEQVEKEYRRLKNMGGKAESVDRCDC